MYAATIASLVIVYRGIFPFVIYGQVAYCPVGQDPRCSYDAISKNSSNFVSADTFSYCLCQSTCGAVTPKSVPLRRGSNLQALLLDERSDHITRKKSFSYVNYVNDIFLFFIIAHGIFGVIEATWTQGRVRNSIFRFLNGTTSRKSRYNFFPSGSSSSILRF